MVNVVIDEDRRCDINMLDIVVGKGATTWDRSAFTITNNNYDDLSFTCTIPRCYFNQTDAEHPSWKHFFGQDSLNVSFIATPNTSNVVNDIGIQIGLFNDTPNDTPFNDELQYESSNPFPADTIYFSGNSAHSTMVTFELGNCCDAHGVRIYRDIGKNTLRLTNTSNVDVTISNLKILRIYKMCTSHQEYLGYCNNNPGSSGVSVGDSGTLDGSRIDRPCNIDNCGGWSVTTAHSDAVDSDVMNDGVSYDWYFDWTGFCGSNYQSGMKCLFNFNEYSPQSPTSNDARLDVELNDQPYTTIYLSKLSGHKSFPGLDLTEVLNNNSSYNDAGYNHVRLTNNSGVNIHMGDRGRANIYRIYNTESLCSCQGCQYDCYVQEGPCCQYFCVTCNYACQDPCVAGCQGCQSNCEDCEFTCQTCITCDWCNTCNECQWSCQPCQDPCYTCASCYEGCDEMCYEGCYNGVYM